MYLLRVEAIENKRKSNKLIVAIIILTLLLLILCIFLSMKEYSEFKYINSLFSS